jgi:hypothetical protein
MNYLVTRFSNPTNEDPWVMIKEDVKISNKLALVKFRYLNHFTISTIVHGRFHRIIVCLLGWLWTKSTLKNSSSWISLFLQFHSRVTNHIPQHIQFNLPLLLLFKFNDIHCRNLQWKNSRALTLTINESKSPSAIYNSSKHEGPYPISWYTNAIQSISYWRRRMSLLIKKKTKMSL